MPAEKKQAQSQRFQPAAQADRQRDILWELPGRMEQRVANIRARNPTLRAIADQNLRIERGRVNAHPRGMPEGFSEWRLGTTWETARAACTAWWRQVSPQKIQT